MAASFAIKMPGDDPIAPNLFYATLLVLLLLLAAHLTGWLVIRVSGSLRSPHTLPVVTLPIGLLVIVGFVSSFYLGRVCHLSMLGLLPISSAVASRLTRFHFNDCGLDRVRTTRRDAVAIVSAFLASVAFSNWLYVWYWPDGSITLPYNDLGYFSILAKELPSSGVMSLWSGTLATHTRAAGATDVWYHWGPIWLGCVVSRLGGISPLVALVHVVVPALTFLVLFSIGAVASILISVSNGKGLALGGLSLIAMPVPTVAASTLMARWMPGGIEEHLHLSMAYRYCFTYRLEAFIVYAVIACWLLRLRALAFILLLLSGISAPHSVAGLGSAAGVLFFFCLVLRRWSHAMVGLSMIAALLLAWAVNVFVFGVNLPKSGDAELVAFDLARQLAQAKAFLPNLVIGGVLALPMVIGASFLIRSNGGKPEADKVLLGALAIAALIGGYAAYHLLLPQGERHHFTAYTHAVLVFPLGTLGLGCAWRKGSAFLSRTAAVLLSVVGALGVLDGWKDWKMVTGYREKFTAADLNKIHKALGGRRFGYYAAKDRPWWIPTHASLAAVLNTSCTRLNPIHAMDSGSSYARFYGGDKPWVLVPKREDETEAEWSLRFASEANIPVLLQTEMQSVPHSVLRGLRSLEVAASLKLFGF